MSQLDHSTQLLSLKTETSTLGAKVRWDSSVLVAYVKSACPNRFISILKMKRSHRKVNILVYMPALLVSATLLPFRKKAISTCGASMSMANSESATRRLDGSQSA